ncbi:MAG: DHH family phosphoesterase [Planctomycetota bacterium]
MSPSPPTFQPPPALLEMLRKSRRPLLLSHIYPDGDGIGSELALYRALEQLGAQPGILNSHATPEKFGFLDPEGVVQVAARPQPSAQDQQRVAEADLCVVLDTSDPERLGALWPLVEGGNAPICVIDHHLCDDPSVFQAIWSETASPSTGSLVLDVIEGLGVAVTAPMATALFVALATDTGWFRFGNASSDAYGCAARLVAAGADPESLYTLVFEASSIARTRLLGELLANAQSVEDDRIVWSVLRREMLDRHGVPYEEIDGFIDLLKGVREAEIVFLAVELSPGRYKVSLRSRGPVTIHSIATGFGGGGHAQAAGCRLEGDEQEVLAQILAAARETIT